MFECSSILENTARQDDSARRKRTSILYGAIVALGLIATVAIIYPNFARRGGTLQPIHQCTKNLKDLSTGLEMYSTDFSGRYPSTLSLLTPNYLKTIPQCPNVQGQSYTYLSGIEAPGNDSKFEDYYYLECTGKNHTGMEIPEDYPRIDSIRGFRRKP